MQSSDLSGRQLRLPKLRAGASPLATTVFALATCAIGPARADPCTINGTTATCSGDQSAGIQINTGSGLTSLFVQSVATNIGPPNGIAFRSEGADGGNNGSGADGTNLSVTTDDTVVIHATGGASGIYVSSTGGNSFDVSQGHGGIAGDVTVSNAGVVTTTGVNAYGILARSIGGNGRPNNQDDGALGAPGGVVTVTNAGTASITTTNDGAAGIYAFSSSGHTTNSSTYGIGVGTVTVTNNGSIETSGTSSLTDPLSFAHGIVAVNIAGSGSDGKNENRLGSASGGNAGLGGDASAVTVTTTDSITTHGNGSYGIYAQSQGGFGGTGGAAGERGSTNTGGGYGAAGGLGGAVTVTASGNVATTADTDAIGIFANSVGGRGGNGGSATGGTAVGRDGGTGGTGGAVTVTMDGSIIVKTHGSTSYGIYALSQGGVGGVGGDASDSLTVDGTSGNGGIGGAGGQVTIADNGVGVRSVTTDGVNAIGIFGESLGGRGGDGANALGSFNANARNGADGGAAGGVTIDTTANVTTSGAGAFGLFAYSQGGDSGNGGHAFSLTNANAGNSHNAGAGGAVSLTSSGTVTTGGANAVALYALSAGGNGGNGNSGDAFNAAGGNGGAGGDGDIVIINANGTVKTTGTAAYGAFAQSAGGMGGNGDDAGGAGGSGGTGGAAGSGKLVTVNVDGTINTGGAIAYGVFAESVGGTGGHGGGGAGVVAHGGTGGSGGNADAVTVTTSTASEIHTTGQLASGIYAKSLGGVGGDGANAGAAYASPGAGGQGGTSGHVIVQAAGSIITDGFGAFGIQAESTGGGGGTAASGSGVVSIGASGGSAANGGIIDVTNDGRITTNGAFSHGIVAASIGGGGGAGSQSGSLVALGGAGNSSGDGDTVTVTNNGIIRTTGTGSYGVYAESVGGGGGNGGGASGFITIGGDGGGGGKGGDVNVYNYNLIATSGLGSHGIFAQSVGGGGGDGGSASSYAGPSVGSVSIGGNGGVASNGGNVLVQNDGAINVSGFRSSAIFAQSTGGGGGNGGDSMGLGVTVVDYTIGGKGGAAGNGGTVEVDNYGTITSHSDLAPAILAQSIGGGGGNGGAAYAITGNLVNATVAIGGSGNGGGDGGTVTVNQTGAITTTGIGSNGITAFSIGGGGGTGGTSMARSISASPKGSMALGLAIGGSGGVGGDGGEVSVNNTGWIMTGGAASVGVFAQSVGGGGGNGGDATATAQVIVAENAAAISIAIGGSGAGGGDGKAVTITNNGRIVTLGNDAHAIVAQSIGGGGGMGGAGRASSDADVAGGLVSFLALNSDDPDPTKPPPEQDKPDRNGKKTDDAKKGEKEDTKISVAIGIGGSGGVAGAGGTVTVGNTGSIDTYGYAAYGIFAQSVGGGGGAGGGGGGESDGDISVGVGLGASSGGAGKGGDVIVTNTGTIATRGGDAYGIFAQSVGGGGGIAAAGDASAGTDVKNIGISVGGSAGSSGEGGVVTVNQTGDVTTLGDRAVAIFAQSIGGGGGVGGTGQGADGGSVMVGGSGSAGGKGGAVNVTMTGDILTFGDGAHGIFAQSVGGGGGVGGDVSGSNPTLISHAMTIGVGVGGAGGGGGNGGDVTIGTTGTITTYGYRTYGIFAQSIGGGGGTGGSGNASFGTIPFAGSNGGAGSGGKITIDQSGSVIAYGLDSHGIFAQSVGGTGGDDITVNLHSGTVSGGGGSAAGIYIDGGKTNSVTIAADATVTALSGLAIKATDGVDQNNVAHATGNTAITNSGNIFGNVDLGSGNGSLSNLASGVFVTGQTINLGSGTMSNAGRLDLGGIGYKINAALNGNFIQAPSGVLVVDAAFGGTSDVLAATGTANVRGKVEPHLASLMPNAPTTIVSAANGFVGTNDVTPINSASVTYGLQIAGNDLQLSVQSAQFVPPAFASYFSPNEIGVANQLQGIWNAGGGAAGMGPIFAYFATIPDSNTYGQSLDRLHGASYASQASAAILTGLNFTDSMMSCHEVQGALAPLRETACEWTKVTGVLTDKGSASGSNGYRDRAGRIQAGRQIEIAPDWFFEIAAGYEYGHTTVGNFSATQADRYDIGLAIKRQVGSWLFGVALDTGYAGLDTTRGINLAGIGSARSQSSIWRLDTRFHAAYLAEFGITYVKPMLDFDVIYNAMPGFSETGAGVLGLRVASASQMMFAFAPSVELGQTIIWNNGQAMRPYIRAGATLLSTGSWTINSNFEGAPAGVASFASVNSMPRSLAKTSAGIDLYGLWGVSGLDLKLQYETQFTSGYQDQTSSIKLTRRF